MDAMDAMDVTAGLPAELLERVLRSLSPADLVHGRRVCRRWRAVVGAMEARDAKFKFACGPPDVQSVPQPFKLFYWNCWLGLLPRLPCTCGAFVVDDDLAALVELFDIPDEETRAAKRNRQPAPAVYAARHCSHLPPARWEVLRVERNRALELTRHALLLSKVFLDLNYEHRSGGTSRTWMPCWVYLPDNLPRPQTVPALRGLVRALLETDDDTEVEQLLAQPSKVPSVYATAEANFREKFKFACQRQADEVLHARHEGTLPAYEQLHAEFQVYLDTRFPDDAKARDAESDAFYKRPGSSAVCSDFLASRPNPAEASHLQQRFAAFLADDNACVAEVDAAVARLELPAGVPPWNDAWREDWRLDPTPGPAADGRADRSFVRSDDHYRKLMDMMRVAYQGGQGSFMDLWTTR